MAAINLTQSFREFYALETLYLVATQNGAVADLYSPSQSRWYGDFTDYRREYYARLARALRDYIIVASLGEMRHALGRLTRCAYTLAFDSRTIYRDLEFFHNTARVGALMTATRYSATSIIQAATALFSHAWDGGYGGDAWGNCIGALADYDRATQTTPTTAAWIDHVVDLVHNNGTAFDKQVYNLIDSAGANVLLRQDGFLNFKRYATTQEIIDHVAAPTVHKTRTLLKLLERAQTVGLIEPARLDQCDCYRQRARGCDYINTNNETADPLHDHYSFTDNDTDSAVLDYTDFQFGTADLPSVISHSQWMAEYYRPELDPTRPEPEQDDDDPEPARGYHSPNYPAGAHKLHLTSPMLGE